MSEFYKFFSHKQCEYFPCHKTDDPDNFNCLFCFCPLYLKEQSVVGISDTQKKV